MMAKHKKPTHCQIKSRLNARGVDFSEDFHALPRRAVDEIIEGAKDTGYRKRKDAPGSRARMYFHLLKRKKC